jgi:hypothetical protein
MRTMKGRSLSHALAMACLVLACLVLAAGVSLREAQSQPAASLNYEFFKSKVEPVFLEKRAGHTRCVVCHTTNNAPFHLVPLSPGARISS